MGGLMPKNYKYLSRYRFSKPLRKIINRINHRFASRNIKRGNPRIAIFAFDHIGLEINNFGIYEEDLLNAIMSFAKDKLNLKKLSTFIDVGANIGNHSLYFSKISKKVFSYEPNPNTYELLKFNTRNIPNISACCLLIFPVGIGLKQVLVIKASKSASYHMFKHPAAPAPIATKIIPIIALVTFMNELEVKNPTAHVNIARDITLGFISNQKHFR